MDPEKAKFIFRNTEAYLRATVEISESLDRKIFNLLSLTFSASLALLGFLLVSLESGFESNLPYSVALLATGSLLLLSLLVVSLMLLHGYSPHKIHHPGNYPANLMEPQYMSQELAAMMMGESANHRQRIDENAKLNQRRAELFRQGRLTATASLLLTPVAFALLYWLLVRVL